MAIQILVVVLIWLLAIASSVLAFALIFRSQSRRLMRTLLLAVVALVIGGMGVTGRTPLGFFSEVGWRWTNDAFQLSLRSSWLFIAPLVTGCAALVLAIRKHLR